VTRDQSSVIPLTTTDQPTGYSNHIHRKGLNAMTFKIFTDNEYSHTIELDFMPEVNDIIDRCYHVLSVIAVEAARPYTRVDCEVQ
jgi:hypothetical protein